MRILMVADHGCIRVVKEALALQGRGHQVDLVTHQEPFGYNRFDRVSLWHDRDQLIRAVQRTTADVIHVHNEPDGLVGACREASPRPIVYDIHDLDSLRMQAPPVEEEVTAFAAADGYVHISAGCQQAAERTHPDHVGKPSTILPCYVNQEFYADTPPRASPDAIVYEGGVSTSDVVTYHHDQSIVSIRNLKPMVIGAVTAGLHVGLCPATPQGDDHTYANLGATVWGPLPYPVMLRSLRPYGWGFVGACSAMPLMHAAMPNKLFEYLSQGVVPVVHQADTAAQFVRAHGIGVVLEDLDDWTPVLHANHMPLRLAVLDQRRDWTMERHIDRIETLYEQVLDAKSRIRGLPVSLTANDDLGGPV